MTARRLPAGRRPSPAWHSVCAMAGLLLLIPGAVWAEAPPATPTPTPTPTSTPTPTRATAGALFYDARALMAKGRYAEARLKLEQSLRLDAGIGTRFNLADCDEHLGRIASAWEGFQDVAAQAKAAGQAAREKIARERAQALAPRLPKLVIDVSQPPPGIEIRRDGVPVGAAAWGATIPVDPGLHTITATAPGKRAWEATVLAVEGKLATVTVPAPLEDATVPAVVAVASNEASDSTPPAPDLPGPVDESRSSAQETVGYVVGTLGVVGLGVAAGFGIRSMSKRDEARDHCSGDLCDATGVGLRQEALTAGNVATAATIAGGVAIVGGLLLVVTSPKASTGVRAAPLVGWNVGGVTIEGPLP